MICTIGSTVDLFNFVLSECWGGGQDAGGQW